MKTGKERTVAKCQDDDRLAYFPNDQDLTVVMVSSAIAATTGDVAHWEKFTLGPNSTDDKNDRREAYCAKCSRLKEFTLAEIEQHLATGSKKAFIFRSPFPGKIG